jgi:hypothetical protein
VAQAAQVECRAGSNLNDPAVIIGVADLIGVGIHIPSPDQQARSAGVAALHTIEACVPLEQSAG